MQWKARGFFRGSNDVFLVCSEMQSLCPFRCLNTIARRFTRDGWNLEIKRMLVDLQWENPLCCEFFQLFTLESWENLHFFNFTEAKVCGSRQLMLFPVYLYGETWGIPVRMNGSCSLPEGTCTGCPAGVYSDVSNPGKALKSMGFLISSWSFQR